MQTLTGNIVEQGLANRILRVSQLKRLVKGSDQSRHNLVHRAIKAGELIGLQRGLYLLDDRFRECPCHPFALAQDLSPGSYISFETALAWHGWIPETVFTFAGVVPGRRSRRYAHDRMGVFSFHPIAVHQQYFFELVHRHRIDGQTMLVAAPFRALMDMVCLRKWSWEGIEFLLEGLRIDMESLGVVTQGDIDTLHSVYKHRRVRMYLDGLRRELYVD